MRVLPAGQITLPNAARPALDKRLFSANEAACKSHCPMAKNVFGFHALAVDLSKGCARFTDHLDAAAISPESRMDLPTRQAAGGGLILSLSATPAHSSSN